MQAPGAPAGGEGDAELVGRVLGNDVDDAVDRVGAPGHAAGTADDFDPFNVLDLERPGSPERPAERRIEDLSAVNEHERVVCEKVVEPAGGDGEVAEAEQLLEEAEQLPSLLFDSLKCEQPPLRATPASILVLNALANAAAGRDPVPKPILREEANVFQEQMLQMNEDQLLTDSLAVLASVVDVNADLPRDFSSDPDPMRRLIVRLIRIGCSRLGSDASERILLIENF